MYPLPIKFVAAACCWAQRILLDREFEYLERAKHRPTAVTQVTN